MISFHCQISEPPPYYGTLIGKLSNKEEGISGKIYAVDKSTVFIRNFTYIGENSRTYAYSYGLNNEFINFINTFKVDFHTLIYLLQLDITALFLYAGTLGNDGGYTKTGYPLKNVKGV